MFLDFYQMRQQPFGVTPDPAYLYPSATHREALAALSSGIREGRGFAALIAPPGMGKTTLLYQLLEELHDSARTVLLFQTQCDSRELFQYLLNELRIESSGLDVVAMHARLNEVLFAEMIAGRRFVLVVDEAQNLSDSVLETVRMLSNFETSHTKLLQIVLAGQPQLGERLARPDFAQLRQRIAVRCRLQPFSAVETGRYIDHRLKVARYGGESLFDTEALALIAKWSEGIPRNINNLCYATLEIACAKGLRTVSRPIVLEALGKLEIVPLGSEAWDDLSAKPVASEPVFEMAAEPLVVEAASESKTEPVPMEAATELETEPVVFKAEAETVSETGAAGYQAIDESADDPVATEAVLETATEAKPVTFETTAAQVASEAATELEPEPTELEAEPESEIAASGRSVDQPATDPVAAEAVNETVAEPGELASAPVASDPGPELEAEPVLMDAITELEPELTELEAEPESEIPASGLRSVNQPATDPLATEAVIETVAESGELASVPVVSDPGPELEAEPEPVLMDAITELEPEPTELEAEPESEIAASGRSVDQHAADPVATEAVNETVAESGELASVPVVSDPGPELEAEPEPVLMDAITELEPEPTELEAEPESEIAASGRSVDQHAADPVAAEAVIETVAEPGELASAPVAADTGPELEAEPVLMDAITELAIEPIEQGCDAESGIAPMAHAGEDELASKPVATEAASGMTREPETERVEPEVASALKMAPEVCDVVAAPANEPITPEAGPEREIEPTGQHAEIESAMAAFGWDALDELVDEPVAFESEDETESEIELVMIEAPTDLEAEPVATEAATDSEMEPIWAEAVSRMEKELGAPEASAYPAPEAAQVPEPANHAVDLLPLTYGMPAKSHASRWDFRAVALTGVLFLGIMLIPAILKFTTPGQARAESLAKQSAKKPVASPTVSPERSGGYSADPEQVGTDQVITVAAMPQQTLKDISLLYIGRFDAQLQSEISALNPGLTDPDHLTPGQLIRLPLPPGSFKKGGEISTQD